nr:hypothetical protein [Propionicimonas sp.]
MNHPRSIRVPVVVLVGVLCVTGCTVGTQAPSTPSATVASSRASPTSTAPTATVPTVIVRDLPPTKPATGQVVVNDASLIEYNPGGGELHGPVTFSVSGDKVVIDNELPDRPRLVIYRNGRKVRTLQSPNDCCIDLRVEGDRYWTLGEEAAEYVLKEGADRLTQVRRVALPPDTESNLGTAPDPDYVQWAGGLLQRTDTGLFAVPFEGPPVLLEGAGVAPTDPDTDNEGKTVVIKDPGFTARIRTRDTEATATLMARHGGYVYYEVADGVGPNWGYIYQFTTGGTLTHTYTLHEGYIQTSNRTVVITDDGQVYQLVITTKTARVLHIPPN